MPPHARGLHLIFSDYSHRREDRFAQLWTDASTEDQQAGAFHWATDVPADYAARKSSAPLRLDDTAAGRRYCAELS